MVGRLYHTKTKFPHSYEGARFLLVKILQGVLLQLQRFFAEHAQFLLARSEIAQKTIFTGNNCLNSRTAPVYLKTNMRIILTVYNLVYNRSCKETKELQAIHQPIPCPIKTSSAV